MMVRSWSWPDVNHGSLVINTSPGASASSGYCARKCRIDVAIELMWPGVPVTDCAIMLPAGSNTPAERSSDSRTIVVNDVRIKRGRLLVANRNQTVPEHVEHDRIERWSGIKRHATS